MNADLLEPIFASVCETARSPERALELFEAMQRQGLVSDVMPESASGTGRREDAAVIPHVVTYSACEKGKQPERALELFEAMQRQGLVPNVMPESAVYTWRREAAAVMPNVVAYSALISARRTQREFAPEFFEAMQREGVMLNGLDLSGGVDALLFAWPSERVVSRTREASLCSNKASRDGAWTEHWHTKLMGAKASPWSSSRQYNGKAWRPNL